MAGLQQSTLSRLCGKNWRVLNETLVQTVGGGIKNFSQRIEGEIPGADAVLSQQNLL